MMNEFAINPAVAGDDGMTTLTLMGRKEWFSFSNDMRTPENLCFSAQTRILKSQAKIIKGKTNNRLKKKASGRVGFGATFFADNSGAMNKISGQFAYAYHITMGSSQLSFGLAGTMSQIKFNSEYLDFYDNSNEPMVAVTHSPTWIPDFNVGINYMTHLYHIGISAQQIFQSPVMFGNTDIDYQDSDLGFKRTWNILGAAYIPLKNTDWMFEPSFWLKSRGVLDFRNGHGSPQAQLDISGKLFYKSSYWLGISYRTISDFVVMTGFKLKQYYFSYAFDYGFNELTKSTLGSHEISFSIKLGDSARRYNWIERY